MEEEKEAAGTAKRRPAELLTTSDISPKKARTPEHLFSFVDNEDPADELTRLLEGPDVIPFKVTFVPYPYTWQSISPPPHSSYITINGDNEESCGSSFSDSECSVMASIDLAGLNIAGFGAPESGNSACYGNSGETRKWKVEDCGRDSCDWDEEALAAFLGN